METRDKELIEAGTLALNGELIVADELIGCRGIWHVMRYLCGGLKTLPKHYLYTNGTTIAIGAHDVDRGGVRSTWRVAR